MFFIAGNFSNTLPRKKRVSPRDSDRIICMSLGESLSETCFFNAGSTYGKFVSKNASMLKETYSLVLLALTVFSYLNNFTVARVLTTYT